MAAPLHDVPRSGGESGQAGGRGGGLQKQLISPVPPPLRRRMADRLPADHPLPWLHGPLREDETLSERRRRRRAARRQFPTALAAAASPTGFRSEEHTSELQSRQYLVCRLLLEKKRRPTASPHYSTAA